MGYSHGACGSCCNPMQSIDVVQCNECDEEFHRECWDNMENPDRKCKDYWVCDSCWDDNLTDLQEAQMLRWLFRNRHKIRANGFPWNTPAELRRHLREKGEMTESYRKRKADKKEEEKEEEDEAEKEDEEEEKEEAAAEKEEEETRKRKSEKQKAFDELQAEWEADDGYESPPRKPTKRVKGSKSVAAK